MIQREIKKLGINLDKELRDIVNSPSHDRL
jgi:hypothetical protein